jgi:hypothetical protein
MIRKRHTLDTNNFGGLIWVEKMKQLSGGLKVTTLKKSNICRLLQPKITF